MAVTHVELEAFCRFAEQKLSEKTTYSMLELVALWDAQETVAELYRAIPDILSGRGRTIAEVDASIREKRGWAK